MTKQELIEKLQYCKSIDADEDLAHTTADEALLEYINDPEVTELFNSIHKWYA